MKEKLNVVTPFQLNWLYSLYNDSDARNTYLDTSERKLVSDILQNYYYTERERVVLNEITKYYTVRIEQNKKQSIWPVIKQQEYRRF